MPSIRRAVLAILVAALAGRAQPGRASCEPGPAVLLEGIGTPAPDLLRMAQLAGAAPLAPDLIRRGGARLAPLCAGGDEFGWAARLAAAPEDRGLALLPVRVGSIWNERYPGSGNDGLLWAGRGFSTSATAGAYARVGPLSAALAPEVAWQQNAWFETVPTGGGGDLAFENPWYRDAFDAPQRFGVGPFARASPGQSFVRLDAFGVALGASTENLWLGPGQRNAIVFTNAGPGFPHLFLGTSAPVSIGIGKLEALALWGRLDRSRYGRDRGHPWITALAVDYEPRALVAGNALARGGVESAAMWASAVLAAAALALAPGRRRDGGPPLTALALGLAGGVVVVALQLLPLPPALLRLVSPATAEALEDALAPLALAGAWWPVSLDPGATAAELAKAATLTAVAAAAAILAGSEPRRHTMLRGIALSGVAVATVYCGAALLGVAPLVAPQVIFVNTNHLAGFFQLAAWPALGFALRARGPARVGWILAFAFTASGVFLSLSRAGIAAFFVGMGIFAVLRVRSAHAPTGAGRAGTQRSVAAMGIAAALALAAWLGWEPIVAELRTVSEESTAEVKLGVLPPTLAMLREFPLVGIGRGAFATVYPAYKSEPLQRTFTHVENEWLQLPVELGVVAGVGLVGLCAWAFVAAARRRDVSRPLAGALAGAGAVAAQNVFDFGLEIPGVAIPFALVLGIASRELPRVEVRSWVVRGGAAVLLALAALGLAIHRAHPTDLDADAVVAAASADEAMARAREALRWHPADSLPQAAVGTKLVSEGRCGEAVPWLTRAMRRNPTAPEPHHAMASCLARAGEHALAKREYRLAFLFGDAGALRDADAFYRRPGELLEIAPDTPAGLLAAGNLLRDRPAEAGEAWRRAWESFGETPALGELAAVKLALGEREEALALARRLQEVAPRSAAGYTVASRALDALGRGDDAQAELELGASRLPGEAGVLVPLGLRHLGQRRYSQAKATFEGIVAKDGGAQTRRRVLVARALEGQGRLQEALKEAQTAREVTPDDLGALETFARLAAAVGRYDEAVEALERAARLPTVRPGAYEARLGELRAAGDEQRMRRMVQP